MTSHRIALALCLAALAPVAFSTGCDPAEEGPRRGGSGGGKSDDLGSCASGGVDLCGGEGSGDCYCDDACESYGDCCSDKPQICDGEPFVPAPAGLFRIATYNLEDVRTDDLRDPEDERLRTLASVIQAIQPDIILINEIAYDQPGDSRLRRRRSRGSERPALRRRIPVRAPAPRAQRR